MKTPAILLTTLLIAGAAFAQGRGQHRQFYNPDSIVTITGTIAEVDSVESPRGNMYMMQMTVQDTSGKSTVMVGPNSYLAEQGISFSKGDTVQVTGSKVHFNDNEMIIAGQIVVAGKTIKLRDESGRPVWFRGGMK